MFSGGFAKWAAGGVVLAALVASHWYAYRLGGRAEHEHTQYFAETLFADDQRVILRDKLDALRVLANHPDAFRPEEVKGFCTMARLLADDVEKLRIGRYREEGNDPEAQKWQAIVDEVRQLCGKITRQKG